MLQAEQILHERYQLKQKLGQNAGRQTWLCEDIATPERECVIVKLLCFGGEVQWDDLKLFEREAQVLKQLSHPRIPKYRDYFTMDERALWFGLVQEYIPGVSLKEQLAKGKRFGEQEVRKLAADVLNILIYLHELNPPVLHRDIKPSNLIWGEDNQVYLVDFGAVQDKAAQEGATFTVVGTYGYAPMEQFGGRAVPASDLYALGATLIHLLTGNAPADLPQRDLRIQFSDKVSTNPSLVNWIEHLTEPAIERRISNARQALTALQSGLTSSSNLPNQTNIEPTFPTSNAKNCLRRSYGTQVKVSNSPDELLIEISHRNTSIGRVFLLYLFVLFIMNFLLLVVGFMALFKFGLVLSVLLMFLSAKNTVIYFKSDSFVIYMKQLVYTHKQQTGLNTQITDVFHETFHERNSTRWKVTIQAGIKEYSFGQGLSHAECIWVAQEIKDWLGIR